ncbi:MAG: zinc-ribbon domain-containing protein [Eubacteriales bacterium]
MKCRYCGAEMEDAALFCEKCGTPSGKEKAAVQKQPVRFGKILKGLLTLILGVLILWGVVYQLNPDNNILGIEDMRKSYEIAQQVILEELSTPSTAEFPKFDPEFVTQRAERIEYEGYEFRVRTVTAYVDYQNLFGASVRGRYQVLIGLPTSSTADVYYYEIVYLE